MQCIVYDLEASCWEGEPYAEQSEIIEIAAYKVDRFGDVTGPFQSFVKPILYPYLSPYCKELTSIEQSDIDSADNFMEVIEAFHYWSEITKTETILCAWGKYDPKMLKRDCELHEIDDSWIDSTFNVKQAYKELKKLPSPYGLIKSCENEDIDFEGTAHRAIWDTYNLLKLFMRYYKDWNLPL